MFWRDEPQVERIVTLLLTPDQAERLAVAVDQGKLHLALRGYTDSELVVTSGANIEKVMSAFTTEAPSLPPS